MPKVQLSIHPKGQLHEVPEDELPGLRAQGLLVEDEPGGEAPAPASPAAPAAAKPAVKE